MSEQWEVRYLQLHVKLSDDRKTLTYILNSADGEYNFRPVGEVSLAESVQALLERDFDELNAWARKTADEHTPEESEAASRKLVEIGSYLYEELFPAELKREYGELWAKYRGSNLMIITDDPWIPWEIVRPVEYGADKTPLYDEPLCESFRLARWVTWAPARASVALRKGVVVHPEDDLPAARKEREYFDGLSARRTGLVAARPLTTIKDITGSFEGGETQIYHFACHGNFDPTRPNDSPLWLADGCLTPAMIGRKVKLGLEGARPLVFVNACHSGRVAMSLTRLGGWAEQFIRAGASAYIGALWEINDELASRFAVEFYDRFMGLTGDPPLAIGEAFRQARQVLKALDPANPTWLAYVLYANPRAQLAD